MRIVGGSWRGRALAAPPGRDTRPTADRVRQALFNILEHGLRAAAGSPVTGALVLDAFAGTGALGLEALSRGASRAVFIEKDARARAILAANIRALDCAAECQVIAGDTLRPPPAPAASGLVFLDPPYGQGLAERALPALVAAGWVKPGTLAVVEAGAAEALALPEGFDALDCRRYGAARLHFWRRATSA